MALLAFLEITESPELKQNLHLFALAFPWALQPNAAFKPDGQLAVRSQRRTIRPQMHSTIFLPAGNDN